MIAVGGGCMPNREEANRPASIIPCAEEVPLARTPRPNRTRRIMPILKGLAIKPHPPAWPRAGTGPG
jgi:hypothetical protein